MAKKVDIIGNPDFDLPNNGCSGWRSLADCRQCPEYDACDECNRPICKYVAVNVYHRGEPDELICRYCAKKQGWSSDEIKTQAIDPERLVSGEACWTKYKMKKQKLKQSISPSSLEVGQGKTLPHSLKL